MCRLLALQETQRKEYRMPIYACTAAQGRLTSAHKAEIAKGITNIYHEETGAPRYLVQVIFYDVAPGNHYVAGELGSSDQVWVRCDTRSGKTNTEKIQMLRRIMKLVGKVIGAEEDAVAVLLNEIPSSNFTEFGALAPAPGEENAWFSSLPHGLQERLKALA
jgi:phenylpyruvate tautomerase PptA (4-oxalocrotonate tautomerase family)